MSLRNIVAGCLLLVSISLAYYFLWQKPHQESIRLDIEKQKLDLQQKAQEHQELLDAQKIEIQQQDQATKKQVIIDDQVQRNNQETLRSQCLAEAERLLKAVMNDSCPGYDTTSPDKPITCKSGSNSLIESAFRARDQKKDECYKQYPIK